MNKLDDKVDEQAMQMLSRNPDLTMEEIESWDKLIDSAKGRTIRQAKLEKKKRLVQ